jgi:catechol 2,3-dioxygenase-like lactoylglutathione lyase family enzyme
MVTAAERSTTQSRVLADARVVYLFLYVSDLSASRAFYEGKLGLRVIEAEDDAVKYDTGHVILCLNRAADYGITLAPGRHQSTDIVFLVDDLDSTRAALIERGVEFTPAVRYDPGGISDFYDPDGHWFTLYEPAAEAMAWPSGAKIRTVWSTSGRGENPVIGPSAGPALNSEERPLDGKPLIYLFLFVHDAAEALAFYSGALELTDLEGGPCSSGSGGDEEGVIKYDGGGLMLTTHQVWERRSTNDLDDHPCPPRFYDPDHMNAAAIVFHVPDVELAVEQLRARGVHFQDGEDAILAGDIGRYARFKDPSGHPFYVWEPAPAAASWKSGPKLEQILSAAV